MSLNIEIKTIPHKEQRYETCGDWYTEGGVQKFRISELGDRRMEAMVAIHELVEQMLCEAAGISQEEVDKFDLAFEGEGEPGDASDSPYRHAHSIGTAVERTLCCFLGISWADYEERINSL